MLYTDLCWRLKAVAADLKDSYTSHYYGIRHSNPVPILSDSNTAYDKMSEHVQTVNSFTDIAAKVMTKSQLSL